MKNFLNYNDIRPVIILALKEDIGEGDITTNAIFNGSNGLCEAYITAKEDGIFCGGDIARIIYTEIDPTMNISILVKDGKKIKKNEKAVKIKGNVKSLLTGERTCLNFMQRMSGIATGTSKINAALKGSGITLLDTRKTAPGMRLLDKYAVKCGGGKNHRFGLYDMILIKDNHIKAAGSISEAVKRVRKTYGSKYKIEIETGSLDEVREAARCAPDIIMFDNMDKETMKKALSLTNGKIKTEISGNVSEESLREIRDLKVDYVSVGSLTHSVRAFDLSMKIM